MKLYHGSNQVITHIDLDKSRTGKDFGCGFYLRDNYDQAFQMANLAVQRSETGKASVTEYEFDESGFANLKVKRFDDYTVEWAEFILENRMNGRRENIHDYDIVIGPIANDKVGVQIQRFLVGAITIRQMVRMLRYSKGMTIQYFFATANAVKYLNRL